MPVLAAVLSMLFVVILLFVISPVIGGVFGWGFSIIFNDSFAVLQNLLGTSGTGFEIGAVLGFVGAFFKASLTVDK